MNGSVHSRGSQPWNVLFVNAAIAGSADKIIYILKGTIIQFYAKEDVGKWNGTENMQHLKGNTTFITEIIKNNILLKEFLQERNK